MTQTEKTEKELERGKERIVGGALIQAIRQRCNDLGVDIKNIVREFGFTYVYLISLSNGTRPVSSLQRATIEKIAAFIDVPVAQAMVMAGKMQIEDFFFEASLDKDLNNSLAQMRKDPGWGLYAPSDEDWAVTPLRVRIALVLTYEKLRMKDLLRKAELPFETNE